MNELKHKKLPRSNFAYNEHHTEENIKERLIICFSDATGGTKYGMLGAVCYLRVSYAQGGFGWQQLIARTHVAPDKLSKVKRELRALKIGVELAKKARKAIGVSKDDTHIYVDNSIILKQLEHAYDNGDEPNKKSEKHTCAKILNEININNVHFVPSKFNSADKGTRPVTVAELFEPSNIWFRTHREFDQPGIPVF